MLPTPTSRGRVLAALLGSPPLSGHEVLAALTELSGRRSSPGRLLPVLLGLEDAGLLAVDRTGDPYRYALTAAGTAAARDAGAGRALPALLVMVDLVGFTRFTEQQGDAAAHEQAARLTRVARFAARERGGSVVKSLGDGVLLSLPVDADPLALLRDLAGRLADEEPRWQLHAGAHTGAPIRHDGDVFGRDVNLVSRLCALARPGTLLRTVDDGEELVQVDGMEQPVRVRRCTL